MNCTWWCIICCWTFFSSTNIDRPRVHNFATAASGIAHLSNSFVGECVGLSVGILVGACDGESDDGLSVGAFDGDGVGSGWGAIVDELLGSGVGSVVVAPVVVLAHL